MSNTPPEPAPDPELIRGIQRGVDEFNAGKFFECHDTLEEIWQGTRGPARNFLQGLIQVSVGFYHLCNGNLRGAESQLGKGLKNLSHYGDRYLALELDSLRRDIRDWMERVEKAQQLSGSVADLPRLRFDPPPRPIEDESSVHSPAK